MDEGPCEKVHSEAFKADFEKFGDLYMYDALLDKEFSARLVEVDRLIKRARARVEDDKIDESLNPDVNPDILRIHAEMSKIIVETEAAAEAENIDLAQVDASCYSFILLVYVDAMQ